MVLYINTSKEKQLGVFLIKEKRIIDKIRLDGDYKVSENLLKLVNKIIGKNRLKFKDLNGIIMVSGPGPFTSLRIAAAVVNSLAYALKIPVVGIKIQKKRPTDAQIIKSGLSKLEQVKLGTYVSPFYEKLPNIVIRRL